jgi:hypothetical protein
MQKLLITTLATFFFFNVQAQKGVPDTVLNAFHKKFPDATNVKWGDEEGEKCEARFILKGKHFAANFFPNGTWKETEVEITQIDLPTVVLESFKSSHNAAVIRSIEKIATYTGKISYEIKFREGTKNKEIQYDELGKPSKS